MNITLAQIIASNYIKFDRLSQIVENAFVGSDATEINLFIDVNSCLKGVYSNTFKMSGLEEPTELAARFVNMIAHYRRFFIRRYNVTSNIHLVYSMNTGYSNTIFSPEYNLKYKESIKLNKQKTDMVLENIGFLDKLCPYFPDTTITNSSFETSVIIYDIIQKLNSGLPNIIISKDIMSTQLPAIDKNCIVFRPKKHSGEDLSYFVSNGGVIQNFINSNKVTVSAEGIDDGLISFIMALSRLPDRNIKSLFAIPKAIGLVREVIDTRLVSNGYNSDIALLYNYFNEVDKYTCINKGLDNRFKSIDLLYQHAIFLNNPEQHNFKGIQNLYDPRGVQRICMDYFKRVPLDLENL